MATPSLYEIVGDEQGSTPDGWCKVVVSENPGELICAYEELSAMTPVAIGGEVLFTGRIHCVADAEMYAGLSADDMDIDVTECLVYGMNEDGSAGSYSTVSLSLWERYIENR